MTPPRAASFYREIFGKDNFFMEIQDQGLPEEHRIHADLMRIEKELGIPMVATNDSHYLCEDDAHAQDVLVCVQTGKFVHLDDPLEVPWQPVLRKDRRRNEAAFQRP